MASKTLAIQSRLKNIGKKVRNGVASYLSNNFMGGYDNMMRGQAADAQRLQLKQNAKQLAGIKKLYR